MRVLIVSVVFLATVIGLSGAALAPAQAAQPKADAPKVSAEQLDICEVVFRHQFGHNASAVKEKAAAYFLRIFEKDPPEEFLQRFKDNKPPVRKGSEFAAGKGLEFHVDSIKRVDADKAVVEGGYYEAGTSASYNVYTVVRKDGKWVVVSDELKAIS